MILMAYISVLFTGISPQKLSFYISIGAFEMSDLGIVISVLLFGLFCAGIGVLSTTIFMASREDDLKMSIYVRLCRAYGAHSAAACLFRREYLD